MVLLVIFCGVLVAVVIYLAIMYYFLFCKEKPLRDTGIFAASDPDTYIPRKKKKNTINRLAVAGMFLAPSRKHKHEGNSEINEEKRSEAFKQTDSVVPMENILDFEEEKKESHCKEERSVHFKDQSDSCDDHHSSTYERSEEVDHGYGWNNL